jgi:tetratricopeptide (TPR) repeat protein
MQTPEDASPVLNYVYQRRGSEAYAWWEIFRRRHPEESALATFLRIRDVLDPPADRDVRELAKLVSEAEPLIPTLPMVWQGYAWLAVAAACQSCGMWDLELRYLTAASQFPQPPDQADSLLADALRRNERWAEAAEQYEKVWQNNRERLGALYLSGDALERSGRAEDGRRRKEQASQMALDSRARRELALALKSQRLDREAEDQFRLVLRTAPFEHWEWNDAAEQWGDRLTQDQPAEAAAWLQDALLDDLRWNHFLLNNYDYLRAPSAIHRLRAVAAVRAGDFTQAGREIGLALAATPADTQLAQDLVPLLEQSGRQPQADELFGTVVTAISDQLQRYPRSALLHNNLAWTSARCHRCLDYALQHALRAVELDPDNAAYLDTLAEAHFRLGDRDTAVRHSRRAVELRPQDTTLQKQLKRFEQAPLPEHGK